MAIIQDHVYSPREDGLSIPKARNPNDPGGETIVTVPCRECGRPEDEHPNMTERRAEKIAEAGEQNPAPVSPSQVQVAKAKDPEPPSQAENVQRPTDIEHASKKAER